MRSSRRNFVKGLVGLSAVSGFGNPFIPILSSSVGASTALPTTGLIARYEPAGVTQSGGSLTGWTDSSGSGNHVTSVPSAPSVVTVDNRTAVRFASGNYFQMPASLSVNGQSMSVFIVFRSRNAGNFVFPYSPGDGQTASVYLNNESLLIWPNGTATNIHPLDGRFLAGARFNASNTRLFGDGEVATVEAKAATALTGGDFGRLTGGGLPYIGDVEAIFVYNTAISDADLTLLRAYVAANYKVGSASKDLYLVADGDSLTFGFGLAAPESDNNWPTQFARTYATEPKVKNKAQSGATASGLATDASTNIDPYIAFGVAQSYSRVRAWLLAGTNDIAGGATDSDVIASLASWHSGRKTAGASTIAATIFARSTFSGAQNTTRTTTNGRILAGDTGANLVVDLAADSRLSNPADLTYFQADGTHLTAAGYGVIAQLVKAAVG
jgi:lysophospholipase L1-like esterase